MLGRNIYVCFRFERGVTALEEAIPKIYDVIGNIGRSTESLAMTVVYSSILAYFSCPSSTMWRLIASKDRLISELQVQGLTLTDIYEATISDVDKSMACKDNTPYIKELQKLKQSMVTDSAKETFESRMYVLTSLQHNLTLFRVYYTSETRKFSLHSQLQNDYTNTPVSKKDGDYTHTLCLVGPTLYRVHRNALREFNARAGQHAVVTQNENADLTIIAFKHSPLTSSIDSLKNKLQRKLDHYVDRGLTDSFVGEILPRLKLIINLKFIPVGEKAGRVFLRDTAATADTVLETIRDEFAEALRQSGCVPTENFQPYLSLYTHNGKLIEEHATIVNQLAAENWNEDVDLSDVTDIAIHEI